MAIVFGGFSSVNGSGSSFTISRPSGAVSGDLLILCVTSTGIQTPSPGSWTNNYSSGLSGGGSQNIDFWYAIDAGASSYSITLNSSGNYAAVLLAYGNINASSPLDNTAYANQQNSGLTTVTFGDPGSTSHASDALICMLFAQEATAPTYTTPSGTTLRASATRASAQVWVSDILNLGASGTDPGAKTGTLSADSLGWFTLAQEIALGTSGGGGSVLPPMRRRQRNYVRM